MPSKKKASKDVPAAAPEAGAPKPAPKTAAKPKAADDAARPVAPKAPAKTPAPAKPAAPAKAAAPKPAAAKPAAKAASKAAPEKVADAAATAPVKPAPKAGAKSASAAKAPAPAKAPEPVAEAAPTKGVVKKPVPKAAPPAPPAPVKPPPKRFAAALDDMDGPDDDDLEDDERGPARAAVAPAPVEAPAAPKPKRLTPRPVPKMPARKPGVITVAISPDADDAFMLYAITHGKVDTGTRRYEVVRGEIAQLNEEASRGTYDVSAFSFGAWAGIQDRYLMLACGASLGDGVGPVVVSKTVIRPNEVNGLVVGVPGLTTTAALVLRLWLQPARLELVPLPFDGVIEAVRTGKVRAGVLIHEAQLTYRLDGLTKVMDLGRWWTDRTDGLPLPLGGLVVRRDIGAEERSAIALDLKRSIAYAMGHRDETLQHAAQFAKGLPRPLLERYINQYVNELTLDLGERGRQAVAALFEHAQRLGGGEELLEIEIA